MNKFLSCCLALGISLHAEASSLTQLPELVVNDRGELQLNNEGSVYYQPWQLAPMMAPAKVGLFMLMPARPSSRSAIANLKQALKNQGYDYNTLISTTIVNLDDAVFGAGMLVGGELKQDKSKTPALHLIVDEDGNTQKQLGLERKQIHVIIHNCSNDVIEQHTGPVSQDAASKIIELLNQALAGPDCPTPE